MAATTTSSSGQVVSKLQQTAEKLRLETTQLRERLRGERDAVRALRAQHAAELRSERAAARRRHVELEAQLNASKPVASTTTAVVSACEQCAKLRACHEAELRRDRCEYKKRESQLRAQLNEARRESASSSGEGVTCQQCVRLSKDLVKQKELAKDIEERLQKVVEADRLKAADLRAQHEKHIMEMSRITRASKQDVHKMLEELKTKNRIIEQLRRSVGKIRNKGDEVRGDGGGGGAENTQMRKLREDGRRTEQPALLPLEACDPKPDLASLHNKFQDEVVERSAASKHREQMTCGGPGDELEPTTEEDTDSAVSSAPSSLSPQPCSPLNDECGPLRCMMATRASITLHDAPPPTSLSPQPSEGYTTPPLDMWTDDGDNDGVNYNNDDGRTENELTMAKRQVRELERALLMTRAAKSGRHVMALSERIRQLEDRESELLRELGDLREQNELLEFRVLELAECPDRPTIISDQWNEKHDACTGTDDEHLVNQLNEEPVRRRLFEMSRRTYDIEDKRCLLQVLMLLHGLDELSRQHKEGFTIDTNEHQLEQVQLPSQIITGGTRGTVRDRQPDRLVAKVPPFTGRSAESDDDRATPVRAQEPLVPVLNTRGTQTEKSTSTNRASDEENEDARSLNLTVEVRKLDKLRETIEVVGNRNGRLVVSSGVVNSGGCSEQKHAHQLEFYRERVDVLERKVRVYESSGETQVRQLAERLNREVRLQAQVKQLTTAVQKLQAENSRLEEERCELEEAENDTRLHCQRLEAEVVQLERSKMSSKRRAREARNQATYWESMVGKYEERIYELEELECDLRHRLEVMEHTAPAILLFNMWQKMQQNPELDVTAEALDRLKRGEKRERSPARSKSRSPQRRGCACSSANDKIKMLEEERDRLIHQKKDMELKVHNLEAQLTNVKNSNVVQNSKSVLSINSSDLEMMKIVQDLKERERDMKKRIEELEHREAAYMETLQQADDIWADMEMKFKKRISQAEQSEATMRDRLRRLEKREPVDVGELEESERALAQRAERLERDNNRLVTENKRLERELREIREDSLRRTDEVTGRLGVDLEREKRRAQHLEERLSETNASLQDAGKAHQLEVDALKERLSRTTNELVHLEVTNGELREEVDTLECKITEMEKAMKERVTADEQMIRGLSQELNERDRELAEIQRREMDSAAAAGERLGAALQSVKQCDVCSESVSPDLVETVEGVRTMCELVSCPTTRPPDDAQARRRRFGRWL